MVPWVLVTWVHTSNGIWISSVVLTQLTVVSNRQIYRPCYIYSNRLHLVLYIAMWLARLMAVIVETLLVVLISYWSVPDFSCCTSASSASGLVVSSSDITGCSLTPVISWRSLFWLASRHAATSCSCWRWLCACFVTFLPRSQSCRACPTSTLYVSLCLSLISDIYLCVSSSLSAQHQQTSYV